MIFDTQGALFLVLLARNMGILSSLSHLLHGHHGAPGLGLCTRPEKKMENPCSFTISASIYFSESLSSCFLCFVKLSVAISGRERQHGLTPSWGQSKLSPSWPDHMFHLIYIYFSFSYILSSLSSLSIFFIFPLSSSLVFHNFADFIIFYMLSISTIIPISSIYNI